MCVCVHLCLREVVREIEVEMFELQEYSSFSKHRSVKHMKSLLFFWKFLMSVTIHQLLDLVSLSLVIMPLSFSTDIY